MMVESDGTKSGEMITCTFVAPASKEFETSSSMALLAARGGTGLLVQAAASDGFR
jgi:hypothetical protein